MADEFKQFKNTRTGQVLSLSSQDLAGTYASIPTNPEYQPLTQQASTQPSTNVQQAQGQTLPGGQATAPADLISQFRGIDKSGNQRGLAENALSQVQSVTSLNDLLARAKPMGSEIGLLEQGQVYENRDPLAGGAATYNVVDNVRVTADGFRIVDIKTVIPGQSSFPSGQLVQAPNGAFVSQTDAGGFKNITNLKDASFTTDAEADLGFAKQFGQVLESKKQDGTKEFYVHGTGQTFSTRAAAEAAARASDPFGVLSGTLSTPEARGAFQGDLRRQLGGQQSQESVENNVPPGSQESYVQSPASIPFKSGLSDAQQSSIQNLIKARPVSEWNETDIKNWKFATNNAPLPGEAQVDVAQSLGESVVSGRPLTPSEFEAARKKFGVSEANFDKFFVRKGKNIFLKDSAEKIVKEAITGEPTTSSINIDIPSEVSSDVFSETVSDSAIQALIDEQKVFRAKILEALKPSEKELSLQEELGQIRNQINAKLASAEQGILDIQGQPIPMPLLTGQAAALQRQANADLTVLQRQEANLLESLGLERELNDRKLEAAKEGLSFVKDDIDLQFKIQDRIQAQEDRLFERSQALDNKARQDLAMMLEMTQGFSYDQLDAQTQQQLSSLAAKYGITPDLLQKSMEHVKNELYAKGIGIDGTKPLTTNELINQANKLVENGVYSDLGEAINAIKDIQEGRSISVQNANVDEIANAIKKIESGGNYDARGASGEFGAYQFMPGTWSQWSQEYLQGTGQAGQSLSPTPENQDAVAQFKIGQWLDQGLNPTQIASMWNSGTPDFEGKVGVNSKGVPYNVPEYVNKFNNALRGIKTSTQRAVNNEVTRDAQSIMAGTIDINGVSTANNHRAKVASELAKLKEQALESGDFIGIIRASAGGKDVTDTQIQRLTKSQDVLFQLGQLQEAIEEEATGPISGIIRTNNPYDVKAQQIAAILQGIVPNLARGVYGEVGVLTDNDIRTYAQTLPNLKSLEEVRSALLSYTVRLVQRGIETTLKTNAAAGRDVSGFEEIYNSVKQQADALVQPIAPELMDSSVSSVSSETNDFLTRNGL